MTSRKIRNDNKDETKIQLSNDYRRTPTFLRSRCVADSPIKPIISCKYWDSLRMTANKPLIEFTQIICYLSRFLNARRSGNPTLQGCVASETKKAGLRNNFASWTIKAQLGQLINSNQSINIEYSRACRKHIHQSWRSESKADLQRKRLQ